jgi:hypothetical protein
MIAHKPLILIGAVLTLSLPGQNTLASTDRYGAIAYSPSTGAYGYANNYTAQNRAESQALIACEASAEAGDCEVRVWFRNACGALARDRQNPIANSYIGTGWHRSQPTAETEALQVCEANGGRQCRVLHSLCTGK